MEDFSKVEPMPEGDPDDGFWSQTTELQHIRRFARSRGASPYATLGAVLRRVICNIDRRVVLPPTIGGYASLNLFTAPVGVSGGGKDIANEAGRDACGFYQYIGRSETPIDDAPYIHPGSGEGLARIFAGRVDVPGRTSAHLQIPDIATLEALADRKGQTLVGQLLQGWMGQPIGFTNNAKETTTAVGAHSYRLCLSVGVQPDNGGFFMSREKDGFPQRFLWFPTSDPYMPEGRPDPVPSESFELPAFEVTEDGYCVLKIPPEVAEEIWHHHWQVMTGVEGIDPLDKHLKLTQLKTAAAISFLHGYAEVTDDGWKIAGQLIEVSNQVRAELHVAVDARRRRESATRAHEAADRQAIIEERLTDERQQRVLLAIKRKLKRNQVATRRECRMVCDKTIRDYFEPVWDWLISKKFIVSCGGGNGYAEQFEFGPEPW